MITNPTSVQSLLLELGLTDIPVNVQDRLNLPQRKLLEPVPDEPNNYILAIDNSSLETFNVCSRYAEYYLVAGREPAIPSPALVFGGALHKGLEIIYRHGNNDDSRILASRAITDYFIDKPVDPDDYRTPALCLDVFAQYLVTHPVELFTVLTDEKGPWVERSFRLPLGEISLDKRIKYRPEQLLTAQPTWMDSTQWGAADSFQVNHIYILWTGRIDLMIEWDGLFWVLDHKTTSRGGESFYEDFHMSQPAIGYAWAGEQLLGKPVKGLVLNAFENHKPTRTGKGLVLNRRRYEYTPEQRAEWEHNTLTLVSDFLHHLARGFFPMETKWCFGKYGKCKYFDVCRMPAGEQRRVLLNSPIYRNVTWSPENPD